MRRRRSPFVRFRPAIELLEARTTPCAVNGLVGIDSVPTGEFHPVIVAGDPNGSPTDSPSARVDANTTTSPFAGVGSVQVNANKGTYLGTGTPLDATHVLTAGHVVDLNDDGKSDRKDGIKSAYFILNYGGNQTSKIAVSAVTTNPAFTGFNHPSINDDLAILTLASPLPAGVPTYALPTADLAGGTTLTMVGYGRSGDGVSGYTTNASWTIKRKGENNADAFYTQDDAGAPAANEVFRFDFDGPTGSGTFGGGTLGNDRETTLGGGDSGGPSFVANGSDYTIVGVNTFSQGATAPKFGSLGGGINVFPYVGWIKSVLSGGGNAPSVSGGGTSPGDLSQTVTVVGPEALSVAWHGGVTADEPIAAPAEAPPVVRVDLTVVDVAPPPAAAGDADAGTTVIAVGRSADPWFVSLDPRSDGAIVLG